MLPAAVRYCETIYELAEDDIDVVQVRIAERLGVSRPAVREMTSRLADDGYVVVASGRLELTDAGRLLAESAVPRHRLAGRFLVDVLGLGWAEAHDVASVWQGVIDDRTEPSMVRLLGDPSTCPHGNPIPGHALERAGLIPGARVEVVAVSPEGTLAVKASRHVLSLSAETASSIMVRPGDLEAINRELVRGGR